MNRRSPILALGVWLAAGWAVTGLAETIRIASWDFGAASALQPVSTTNRLDIAAAADELKRSDPDVILLQHISDWTVCDRLAAALKPLDYKVSVYSSFAGESAGGLTRDVVSNAVDLELSYSNQIRQANADLSAAQNELEQRRTALGPVGQELPAEGISDWAEVTPATVKTYQEISAQIDAFGDQERDLQHRGYKEGHPLVQAVRAELRDFAARKAELERNSPLLKYIVGGTNAPNWSLAAQLKQYIAVNSRVTTLNNRLKNLQAHLAKAIEAQKDAVDSDRSRSANSTAAAAEVALLARDKAYFSRSNRFDLPGEGDAGGFAFGALQLPKRRVGFFSVSFGDGLQATAAVRQLLTEIGAIRKWEQNPVDTFVIACTFGSGSSGAAEQRNEAVRLLKKAGYSEALNAIIAEQGIARPEKVESRRTECIFVELTTLPLSSQVGQSFEIENSRQPAICDLELDPTKVAAARLARVEAQTSASFLNRKPESMYLAWVLVFLLAGLCLLGLGWIFSGRRKWRWRKSSRLLPIRAERRSLNPSSYTVIVAPTSMTGSGADAAALQPVVPTVHVETPGPGPTQSGNWERRALAAEDRAQHAEELIRQGLLPHLSRWMKEKLFNKLLSDRRRLLAAQEEATRKVIAVDARLSRLESQIQQQTRVYVKRIEELTAELLAAKEENRQLIRAKIAQVKTEMEAARKKLLEEEKKTSNRDI